MLNICLSGPPDEEYRILCLGAHSDDIEIGCGGTVLTLLARYKAVSVHWVVFSSTEQRETEARRSAEAFLAESLSKEIVVKRYRDGFFPFVGAQIKEDFEALKTFNPHLVFTHYRDDRHQDHRLVSDLTWNTFRSHFILEY